MAGGIKKVENRPRHMIKRADFGVPFALHASREIDGDVLHETLPKIAPDLLDGDLTEMPWFQLSRITSAVIAVVTIVSVLDPRACGIDPDSDDARAALPPDQRRWFFGPIGYVLRDVRALAEPVPCRGWQGFWTLPDEIEQQVTGQLARSA